jgi:hypothetical protein
MCGWQCPPERNRVIASWLRRRMASGKPWSPYRSSRSPIPTNNGSHTDLGCSQLVPPCAHGEPDTVTSSKSGSAGGGEETTGRKAGTGASPSTQPNSVPRGSFLAATAAADSRQQQCVTARSEEELPHGESRSGGSRRQRRRTNHQVGGEAPPLEVPVRADAGDTHRGFREVLPGGGPSPPCEALPELNGHASALRKAIMSRAICAGRREMRYGESSYVVGPQRVRSA